MQSAPLPRRRGPYTVVPRRRAAELHRRQVAQALDGNRAASASATMALLAEGPIVRAGLLNHAALLARELSKRGRPWHSPTTSCVRCYPFPIIRRWGLQP